MSDKIYSFDASVWVAAYTEAMAKLQKEAAEATAKAVAALGNPEASESPCPTCSKPNDVGVKSCWWCGNGVSR